jgi:hypothetical protein
MWQRRVRELEGEQEWGKVKVEEGKGEEVTDEGSCPHSQAFPMAS